MKKLLPLVFLLCGVKLYANIGTVMAHLNYYVSASGDNTTGLSPAHAFKTIAKLNASWTPIIGGDSILFNRGEVFDGTVIPAKNGVNGNPIVFSCYGTGAKPIINGFIIVTGWVNLGGNIWEAPVSGVAVDVNIVTRNGVQQQIGRFPNVNAANGGYITTTATTTTTVTGSALSSTTNWTNAEIAVRIFRWEIRRRKISAHSGGTITFPTLGSTPKVGMGYFIQRDAKTLDQDGEWYYNDTTHKLRMFFANNNPSAYTIKTSVADILFSNSRSDITVDNIDFTGSNKSGMLFTGGARLLIQNCNVSLNGGEGIGASFPRNFTVRYCTTDHNPAGGIRCLSYTSPNPVGIDINNNLVTNSCMVAGMEATDIGSAGNAIFAKGDDINVMYNIVTNSGYNAIQWQGNNALIYRNMIDNFCSVRDDGGGIYTYEGSGLTTITRSNRKVIGNIIINGIGAPNGAASLGTDPESLLGARSVSGVYNDEGSKVIDIDSNIVSEIPFHGIQGNGNVNINIIDNILFHCAISVAEQRLRDEVAQTGFVIKRNIMYPSRTRFRDQAQDKPSTISQTANLQRMGVMDSNYYSTKTGTDTSLVIQTADSLGTNFSRNYRNYAYIVGTILREVHSINVVNTGTLEYNYSPSVRTVTFTGLSKRDVYGNIYDNWVNIPAWQGKVLIPNGVVSPVNLPPNANAGTDSTIQLPYNQIHLIGSLSSDPDGTISTYAWSKKSGPTFGAIVDPTLSETVVTNLLQGVYQWQLIITDNGGLKDTALVNTTVLAATPPANISPVVNTISPDSTITLPTNSLNIFATATDADGTIASIVFTKILGGVATITPTGTGTATISGLAAGSYTFQATATDNLGATGIRNTRVTVNPAPPNAPPLLSAPSSAFIQLPTDSVRLTVHATDLDGTISSILWTGADGVIGTPSDSTTIITGLTAGTHTYTVTVTDNDGGVSTADITVTVSALAPSEQKWLLGFKVYTTP